MTYEGWVQKKNSINSQTRDWILVSGHLHSSTTSAPVVICNGMMVGGVQSLCDSCVILNAFNLKEVIPSCIYIFTSLLHIPVNTTTIIYNANATCFDLQQSSSG